jgi:hypothetical protein
MALAESILATFTAGVIGPQVNPLLPDIVARRGVIPAPRIFNVFWSGNASSWNSTNPATFSTNAINTFTSDLAGSSYFNAAAQYGVGRATFVGSRATSGCGAPGSTATFLAVLAYITCEVQIPGTGVPGPNGNSLYNVWLPSGTTAAGLVGGGGCSSFLAYHFASLALTFRLVAGFIPVPFPQDYAYTVLPIDCASGTFDNLTDNATHEMIEASTDVFPGVGWIDVNTFDFLAPGNIFSAGEAADICEGGAADIGHAVKLPMGPNGDPKAVAPYWSNNTNSCFPVERGIITATVQSPLDRAPQCILVDRICAPPPAQQTAFAAAQQTALAAAQQTALAAPDRAIAAATAVATAMPKANAASGIATVMAAARQTAAPAAAAIGTAMAAAQQTAVARPTSTPCPEDQKDAHDRC